VATAEAAQGEIHALRQVIARMEGKENRMTGGRTEGGSVADPSGVGTRNPGRTDRRPLGVSAFDEALDGGLAPAGLTEIRCAETRDWGGASGFAAMLIARLRTGTELRPVIGPVIWITDPAARREGGEIWLPGCLGLLPGLGSRLGPRLGNDGSRPLPPLLVVRPRNQIDALWAAETAASGADIGAVVLELRGNPGCMGLTESRRLHFRARESAVPLLLLRQSAEAEASAAPARFLVSPAPAAPRLIAPGEPLPESLGRPALTVTLEKSRRPAPLSLILEWSSHDSRFLLRDPESARRQDGNGAGRPLNLVVAATRRTTDPGALPADASDRQDQQGAGGTRVAFGRAS
jgi:protein ImuA